MLEFRNTSFHIVMVVMMQRNVHMVTFVSSIKDLIVTIILEMIHAFGALRIKLNLMQIDIKRIKI